MFSSCIFQASISIGTFVSNSLSQSTTDETKWTSFKYDKIKMIQRISAWCMSLYSNYDYYSSASTMFNNLNWPGVYRLAIIFSYIELSIINNQHQKCYLPCTELHHHADDQTQYILFCQHPTPFITRHMVAATIVIMVIIRRLYTAMR